MFRPSRRRPRKIDRRLLPVVAGGAEALMPLEPRLLLSAQAVSSSSAAHAAEAAKPVKHHKAHPEHAAHPPKRLTPAQEINTQYALFSNAFAGVLNAYVQAINEQSTNTVAVTATVTATYTPPAGVIQVNNAAVFGPAGPFAKPVTADALLGTVAPRHVQSDGQLRELSDHQPRVADKRLVAHRDHTDSQRAHLVADECGIGFPQLHHQQHDPTGHRAGEVLQSTSRCAATREHSAPYARTARCDPGLRI